MYPTDGFVFGTVRDQAGIPQAAAQVEVEFFFERCPEGAALSSQERGTTDENGNYRILVRGPHMGEWTACLAISALTDSGLSGSVKGVLLVLRDELHGRPDSVGVDVTVR